jgi:molecular chaperone IbpA
MLGQSAQFQANDTYPPYNIERDGDDRYRISLALAGFSPEEITITAEQSVLSVEGSKNEKTEANIYIGASPRVPSAAASVLPIMFR